MADGEILNHILQGVEWLAMGGFGYYSALIGLQFLSAISPFNEKIKSKEQLEKVAKEEAEKLGLDISKIDIEYNSFGETSIDKIGERHKLIMDSGINCTRGSVRHEFTHVKNRDCEKQMERGLHYYFVAEPRSVLYEVLGIKL